MHPHRQIYLLSPRDLSPETIAVTFAKTSRSPLSFRDIAAELSDEQSAQFHEKWVVGYGHASVAEHAILHIAFENVSRLAIECIESNRLASYTEKSTRYQKWPLDAFYIPTNIAASQHAAQYKHTCTHLFKTYDAVLQPLKQVIITQHPQRQDETNTRWQARIRAKYIDAARYLLPSSALANVGMTANARSFAHAIRKMLSHALDEVRQIGTEVKTVALSETPTLVKYTNPIAYTHPPGEIGTSIAEEPGQDWLELVDYTRKGEEAFLAAYLYSSSQSSYSNTLITAQSLPSEDQSRLTETALGNLQPHEIPLRELEHVHYTFDALMDQGAYFEVKRHRMMTQTPQPLTTHLGYATPRLFEDANLIKTYNHAMNLAAETYQTIASTFPEEASYIVPNGYNRRLLMTMNLREAFHFCELRSAHNAHFAVRRLAIRMRDMISQVHPRLAQFMRWESRPDWETIEKEHFASTYLP